MSAHVDPYASRTIPTAIRRAVLARDGLVCRWCSTVVTPRGSGPWRPDELQFDHVEPWGDGGEHTVGNLVVACARCNLGRKKPRTARRTADGDQRLVHLVEYRSGYYHWVDGDYMPPLALDDRVHAALSLEAYMERAERRHEPHTLLAVMRGVHRGRLPATSEGRVYVGFVPAPPPARRSQRIRMGYPA